MTATTNFLRFNEDNDASRTYNDSEYSQATQRVSGVIPGMALSRMHNKMFYQWSGMSKAIADFLVSKGYDAMDDDIAGITSALGSIIDAAASDLGYLLRKNNTAYAYGDLAFDNQLPSTLILKCTTAGTTASTEPSFSGAVAGGTVTDGTVTWTYTNLLSIGHSIGEIFPYAGTTPPPGALLCDGAAVSRTMYPDLFDEIGTTYGAGDGSTTFNLPNLVDKFIEGDLTSGTVKAAGLPNITGQWGVQGGSNDARSYASEDAIYGPSGAAGEITTTNGYLVNGAASAVKKVYRYTFDASQSNAIYGASETVQPPAVTMRYYIQAFTDSTDPALVDLTQILQDLANKLTREQTPAFNKRDVITTSGTYTAPVTGWYRIEAKGGGGGGGGGARTSSVSRGGQGGGEGGTTIGYEHLDAGDSVTVVIGAGGTGGAASTTATITGGGSGGNTTVTVNGNSYVGGGANGVRGGSGTIPGAPGQTTVFNMLTTGTASGGSGGGNGGSAVSTIAGSNGGGGCGGYAQSNTSESSAGSAGGDGYAAFEYFAAS